MELYYNPEQMSETEIKQTFVGRQWLIDELLTVIKRQPKGAGVQHGLIIGPRGMGKTTMLLMLRLAVLEGALSKKWQPVRFPEESYGINDLADLWLTAIANLSFEVNQPDLLALIDRLKAEYKDSSELGEAAHAALKDWSRKSKRRLLLLVDNLDMILDQIGSSEENAALRNLLMNDGTIMLVGAATSFFKEARSYDQPLYNFFRIWNLDVLDSAHVDDLLRQRAAVDRLPDFEQRLCENRTRIDVLHYFTGGNPRLILMLYRIIASSEFGEVQRSIEKLLDEVTPYYKAKIESLPAQQRKVLDCIARISARTGEGLTPTAIAKETRLSVNQASSQLKRLSDLGYVRAADTRKRNSYYSLSEPLYAIWHQMRFGREGRRRMEWLVEFLKHWYSDRELLLETERLAEQFRKFFSSGRVQEARQTIESRSYLSAAMDLTFQPGAVDRLVCDCLESGDTVQIQELLRRCQPAFLSDDTRSRLYAGGFLTDGDMEEVSAQTTAAEAVWTELSALFNEQDWECVLARLNSVRGHFTKTPELFLLRAIALAGTGQYHLALPDIDVYLRKNPNDTNGLTLRAFCGALAFGWHGVQIELPSAADSSVRKFIESVLNNPSFLFPLSLAMGWYKAAFDSWIQFSNTPEHRRPLVTGAIQAASPKNLEFILHLVGVSQPCEEFNFLQLVLNCFKTGDASSIEKTSSEVQPLLRQFLAAYQERAKTAPAPTTFPPLVLS